MSGPPTEPRPSQQRWAQVRALLERALDLPPADREAFVAREAGSDAALQAEVLSLLAGEDSAALDAPEGWPGRVARENEPRRAGPWRLLRRIGAGGMGEVYLGVRADGQFKRRVAVKLVKLGMDTAEVLRRFEREREVLAALDHPGIARLLDGGVGPDGRPYLALEFVEGEPLDRWCDLQRLDVRERVALFAEVCDAVEVAHRSHVVHRDLKPGNVLVDVEGRPKLLDFGIAKVLSGDLGPATVELTDTPLRLLTPSYASPEQIRGGAITPASDVYSLGAMLYELLAGRRPLPLQALSPLEIERTICEREPVRPSHAVTEEADAEDVAARRGTNPRGLRRELEGDLDTIVLEALRKEPRRRYASAAGLAADLRRHLEGRPVGARPDTLRYRASKFVRRNRMAVGAAAVVLAALVGGLSVSLWQYGRARAANAQLAAQAEVDRRRSRELERLSEDLRLQTEMAESARGEAELQRERSERRYRDLREIAREGIFDVHRSLVKVPGVLDARQRVVELGVHLLERLSEEGDDDPSLRREMVGGLLRLAEGQQQTSGADGSRSAAATYDRAVSLADGLVAEDADQGSNRFALAQALYQRGEFAMRQGRSDTAAADFERALELCGGFDGPPAAMPGLDYVRAMCLQWLAARDSERGDFDLAERRIERSLVLLESVSQRVPGLRADLATPHFARSGLERARGDLNAAIDASLEGLDLLEAASELTPENVRLALDLCAQRMALAHLFLMVDDVDAAQEALSRSRDDLTRLGVDSGRELLSATELEAAIATSGRDWGALERIAASWVASARRRADDDPGDALARLDLARAQVQLALALARRERPLEAEDALRLGLAELARLPGGDTNPIAVEQRARAHERLGELYEELAGGETDPARALGWMRRARDSYGEALDLLEARERAAPGIAELRRGVQRMKAALERCEGRLTAEGL